VIGRLADTVNLGAGSSDVWDLDCHTVLDGLRTALSDVDYDDGSDIDRAAGVAAEADVALVVAGYMYLDEQTFEIQISFDRLATREPVRHVWKPPLGRHRFVVARFAGDPNANVIEIDL